MFSYRLPCLYGKWQLKIEEALKSRIKPEKLTYIKRHRGWTFGERKEQIIIMVPVIKEVRKIFNLAQDGVVPSKLCDMLSKVKEKNDDDFWLGFLDHVQKSMIYYKTETVVERVMELIATFATYATIMKSKVKTSNQEESSEENEDDAMDPLLVQLLNFLIENHNARDKGVRFRCCQLINKVLGHLGDEDTIDEDISDAIYECMMIRIKDKFPPIRIQAVLALVRLQDPEDDECPVIDSFLHSLETDTNADVRRTILTNIALSRKTLPYVLVRIRDVKDVNRKAAYLTLSEKVSIRALTIAQRINVLTTGLNDRSELVKQACGQLLKSWLRSYDHKVIKLLEALDTEGSKDCSKLVLESLFKGASVEKMASHIDALLLCANPQSHQNEVKMIDHDMLTPENVFYWLTVCKHLKTMGDDGEVLLQRILPELTNFCEYIQSYAERNFIDSAILTAFEGKEMQPEFILEHLLNIAGLLDLSDEVGRKNLQQLVHNLLVTETIPISLVHVLVTRYVDVETNEEKFVQALVETIADVKQPMVQVVTTAMKESNRRIELQIARVTMNLNECKEELEGAIKSQDFQQAALLKDQIAELQEQKESLLLEKSSSDVQAPQRVEKDDPETMLKCLTIASSLLRHIKTKGLNSTLMTLKDELIFEGVKNEDPFIRNEAVKCLGHLSLLRKEFACQHLVLFLQVAQVDQELLQITAVQVIFDLFLIYGLQAFDVDNDDESKMKDADDEMSEVEENDRTIVEETPPEEMETDLKKNNAAEKVLGILLMFLESESADLRTTVAEGLAKLLISGRIVSAKILTRLILLWYNPITEDDIKLRHCLGVFLPVFAFENKNNQELIEECFLPVVKTLFHAPTTSPLSKVNISNVIELLLQLTDVRNLSRGLGNNNDTKDRSPVIYESHVHDSIAIKVANEILKDPEDSDVKILCKTLNMLFICPLNHTVIQDLLELNVQMLEALTGNRFAKKMIEKFHLHIQGLFVHQGSAETSQVEQVEVENQEEDKEQTEEERISMQDDDTASVKSDNTVTDDTGLVNDHDTTLTDIGAVALQKQLNVSQQRENKKHKMARSNIRRTSKRTKMNTTNASVDFHIRNQSSSSVQIEEDPDSDDLQS